MESKSSFRNRSKLNGPFPKGEFAQSEFDFNIFEA